VKRTGIQPGAKSLQRGSTFAKQRTDLRRREAPRRRSISPASNAQRAKVRDRACIVCARGPCHPAHLIDRALGGNDDPRAVVPLCPSCHRLYDDGTLSLLEHLEPRWREELAYAVELVGMLAALQQITNSRWEPIGP
jgi:hypothetical protein